MSSFKKQAATVLLAAGLATTGCADDQARAVSSGPGVVGVARDAVVVGEQVVFYAQGLAPADADLDTLPTEVQLVFEGAYAADDGQTERVSFEARALVDGRLPDGREVVRLNRFGPFRNPFSAADRPGRFRGTVKVVELSADGAGRVGPARDQGPERFSSRHSSMSFARTRSAGAQPGSASSPRARARRRP